MRIGEFLHRVKIPVEIKNTDEYKRVTIRGKHQGINIRDVARGSKIGTKLQFKINKGQFLLSKIDARLGAFGIVPEELDDAIITGNFWAFDVDYNKVNIKCFNLFTASKEFYEVCNKASSGTTHRKYLDETLFLNFEVTLPNTIEKQDVLVKEYQQYESIHSQLEIEISHQQSLLKKLKQAILQEAVQGKLVPQDPNDPPASELLEQIKREKELRWAGEPASELLKRIKEEKASPFSVIPANAGIQGLEAKVGFPIKTFGNDKLKKKKQEKPLPPIKEEEIPFALPKGWVWCRLGEISKLITSGSRDWAKYYSQTGAIFVRMGNLSRGSFDLRMNKLQYVNPPTRSEGKRTKLLENDILISITGEVGNLGLIPKDFGEAYINQHTALVRLNKTIIIKYICYCFLSPCLQNQFSAPQRGMKNSYRLTDIEYLLIPTPPIAEQKRIVEIINALFSSCDLLEKQIEENAKHSELLLQAVLKEAFEPKTVYKTP